MIFLQCNGNSCRGSRIDRADCYEECAEGNASSDNNSDVLINKESDGVFDVDGDTYDWEGKIKNDELYHT